MKGDITKTILDESINAPSGSNSQPWHFVKRGDNSIDLFAQPEKDHPVLNYRNRGTLLAHGALIENIKIVAASHGMKAEIELFPDTENQNHTARITFVSSEPSEEVLAQAIPRRATNRLPYRTTLLTKEQISYLSQSVSEVHEAEARIMFITDPEEIQKLAQAAATNEIITLEDRKLHGLFFDEIVWSEEEEAERKMGLYLKTMGLKRPQEIMLSFLRSWPLMRLMNTLGFAKLIAKQNANVYGAAPAIGILTIRDDDREFLTAGRCIERLWLKATQLGFGFHLMTGTCFYWQCAENDMHEFSSSHKKVIADEYRNICSIAQIEPGHVVAALFRIGIADSPKALSTKSEPRVTEAISS